MLVKSLRRHSLLWGALLGGTAVVGASLAPAAQAAHSASPAPTFRSYHGPYSAPDLRGNYTKAAASGEPSIGLNAKTGALLFMSNKNTYRVTGFDPKKDEVATWTDVTDPVIGAQTSDPILYTDPVTNRAFANQLELQGGSLQAYTDDDGAHWTHSTMGGGIGIAFDHQTIVAGKNTGKNPLIPTTIGYPNVVYYCTNDLYAADCAPSIDGGLNFLVATPAYVGDLAGGPCSAIFGHIKTDPNDGTLYLPPEQCGDGQRLYVSEDNAKTWRSSTIPDSAVGDGGHPSVAVGNDGTLYLSWTSDDVHTGTDYSTGRVHVAVSTDHGKTWVRQATLGSDLGIASTRFPVAVAGDGDRAAVAYIGTTTTGDPGALGDTLTHAGAFAGQWHLYVSYTFDRGKRWVTYDATPTDAVQVGPVCTAGTTCTSGRNLLDFNDLILDGDGRVVVAMSDGCTKDTCDYVKELALATIVRQVNGPRLRRG